MTSVLVALGGAIGALARYLLDHGASRGFDDERPWGILTANVLGSLALGAVYGLAQVERITTDALRWIGAGALGGFTTFSAVALDTILLGAERRGRGVEYLGITLVAGIGSAAIGVTVVGGW